MSCGKGTSHSTSRSSIHLRSLEEAIRKKAAEGYTARMTAGFCWKWSNPRPDGTLVEDVVIGEYQRPWNARPEAARLAKGIPKASLWAHLPGGIDQVGCIYTAQGFEFDYVGVIFGKDLLYRFDRQDWVGTENSRMTPWSRGLGASLLSW